MKIPPNLIETLSTPPLEWITSVEVFKSELEVLLKLINYLGFPPSIASACHKIGH